MNEKKPWYTKKKVWKWIGISFLALFIIGKVSEITGYSDKLEAQKAEEKAAAQEKQDADKKKRDDELAAWDAEMQAKSQAAKEEDEKREAAEKERLAKRTNKEKVTDIAKEMYGEDKFVSAEYVDGIDIAVVKIRDEVVLTPNMLKKVVLNHTKKFLEDAKDIKELKGFDLNLLSPVTDQYGNVSDEKVMSISVSRNIIDKINYDNFDSKKLPEIADDYWEHPSFSE